MQEIAVYIILGLALSFLIIKFIILKKKQACKKDCNCG